MSAPALAGVAGAPSRLRALTWRHPEWWIFGVAAAGWTAVAAGDLFEGTTAVGVAAHQHTPPVGTGAEMGVAWIGAMTIAMMLPLAVPGARFVSLTSFWSRRYVAQAFFLLGFLVPWIAVAAMTVLSVAAVQDEIGRAATIVVFFGLAAAWQFSLVKRRFLRRCRRTMAIASEGLRANWDCVSFGAAGALSCVVTCGLLMAAVAAAGHGLVVMGAVFGLQLHERIARRYRPGVSAMVLIAIAAVSLT